MSNIEPYDHDCDRCQWVGWHVSDRRMGNVYFCPNPDPDSSGPGSIVIRYSDEPDDYWSSLIGACVKGPVGMSQESFDEQQRLQLEFKQGREETPVPVDGPMRRLYNEYDVPDSNVCQDVRGLLAPALREVINRAVRLNISLMDVEQVADCELRAMFAEARVRRGIELRKQRKEGGDE